MQRQADQALELDHIAVVAPRLEVGLALVREALGVDVPAGGAHPEMGTHNHLMRLGDDEFLEVIAPDPNAEVPVHPRVFALDRQQALPARLCTWVLRTPDIGQTLTAMPPSVGQATRLSRGDLSWPISVPDDGAMPFEGAHPTIIEWAGGIKPGASMPDLGCRLHQLRVLHPNATEIDRRLAPFFRDERVLLETADRIEIVAQIETPSGIRRLA